MEKDMELEMIHLRDSHEEDLKKIDLEAKVKRKELNEEVSRKIKANLIETWGYLNKKPRVKVGEAQQLPSYIIAEGLVKEIEGLDIDDVVEESPVFKKQYILMADGIYKFSKGQFAEPQNSEGSDEYKNLRVSDLETKKEANSKEYLLYGMAFFDILSTHLKYDKKNE